MADMVPGETLLSDPSPAEGSTLHRRDRVASRDRPASTPTELDGESPIFWTTDEPHREHWEQRFPTVSIASEGVTGGGGGRGKRFSTVMFSEAGGSGGGVHAFNSSYRPPLRSHASSLADSRGHYLRNMPAQLSGFYLVKFAVTTTACYIGIQLLISFAEVLLPFIFAVLCVIILEPLKKFIMRVFQRLAVLLFQTLQLNVCLETHTFSESPKEKGDEGYRSEGEVTTLYGSLPQDSPGEDSVHTATMKPVAVPVPTVKKLILAISIVFCMLLTGRVVFLTAKVFFRAGYMISMNIENYRKGTARLKLWFETWIKDMRMEALDYGELLDDLVVEVETIGSVVTQNVLYTVLQAVVTFIFLIYMLWSPIKMEASTVTREVFISTSRYLKVKCAISAFTGLSVGILLWAIGLDLPSAFGLLAFLANFLPGIGSFVASVLPCILAAIDVRKTPTQVLLAFVCQLAVHFVIDFVIEPVFFGISVEIHSVIVILGIWFFYQVWGVPGMLLSVPLLAVMRIMMKSMKQANRLSSAGGEDADAVVFLDNILEGRWMSSLGDRSGDEELELPEFSIYQPKETATNPSGEFGDPDTFRAACQQKSDPVAAIYDSQFGKDVWQCYHTHRLLIDVATLLLIMGIVLFAPL